MHPMRSVLSAILVFEAIVVALAIPVAISIGEVDGALAGAVGGGVAAACLVSVGLLRFGFGPIVGSVLQVVALLLGFAVPLMFVLGAVFGVLWFVCLVQDRRLAVLRAERDKAAQGGARER